MKYAPALMILVLLILSGCSSVSIVPRPATAGAVINSSDQSIKINNSNLIVSARVQDTAVGGYDIDTALAAFYLTVHNRSGSPVQVTLDKFSLRDSGGTIHSPVTPEEVNAILNPAIGTFLPYPFVGFYSVIDLEQYRSSSAMASERAYVGSGLPSVETLTPLPVGRVENGQQMSGMLYFKIEIIDESFVELKADLSTSKVGRELSFSFPFSIEK